MKKYNLLKVLLITIFVAVLLTWLIPGSSYDKGAIINGDRNMLGIWTLATYPMLAVSYFAYIGIFIIIVGGFYGVVNKTGVYKNVIDLIVKKFKGNEKIFIIMSVIMMALLSSFTNLSLALFVFVPFLISIILLMGYDRIVALLSTIGAIFVGFIGSTYNNWLSIMINRVLGIEINTEMISRVFLLVISAVVLIFFILDYINKKSKDNNEKKYEDPLLLTKTVSKKKSVPLVITLIASTIIIILSSIPWKEVFGVEWFEQANKTIFEFKLFGFDIFNKVLGNIAPFGSWTIVDISIFLIFISIVLAIVYKIKLDDAMNGFIEGSKKMLQTAGLIVLAYVVWAIVFNQESTFYITVMDYILSLTKGFNIITTIIVAVFGSVMAVDMNSFVSSTLTISSTVVADETSYGVMGVLIQSIYGLTMFVAPTSALLLVGLNYLKVPYMKWLKHIAILLLQLLLLIIIISTLIMVI